MALDLSKIRDLVENDFMVDTCRITRNDEGTADEAWDAATMTYSGGDPDSTVYEGKCYVSTTQTMQEIDEGGQATQQTRYYLNIPLDADPIEDDDVVEILTATNDPGLVGARFIIRGDDVGTYKIKRRIHMVRVRQTERG